MNVDNVHIDVSYPLTMWKIGNTDTIAKAILAYDMPRGILFLLCEKVNFDFKDTQILRGSTDRIDCPTDIKRREPHHANALLPHKVIHVRCDKLDALRDDEGSRPNRRDYLGFFVASEVRATTMMLIQQNSREWISDQLHSALLVVSFFQLA